MTNQTRYRIEPFAFTSTCELIMAAGSRVLPVEILWVAASSRKPLTRRTNHKLWRKS